MTLCIVVSMWCFDVPFSRPNVNVVSVSVAGFAACKMICSPENMADYFWPKILAMLVVAFVSLLLVCNA